MIKSLVLVDKGTTASPISKRNSTPKLNNLINSSNNNNNNNNNNNYSYQTTVWSASPSERSIKVWNSNDYLLRTIVQNKEHSVYCLEKHGDFVWAGGNGEIFLYKIDNYLQRGYWRVHDSSISCLKSFGNRIWSGSATGELKIWEDKVRVYSLRLF